MDWIVAIAAIASGVAGVVYVLDYFGFLRIRAMEATATTVNVTPRDGVRRQPSGWLVLGLLAVTMSLAGYDLYRQVTSPPSLPGVFLSYGTARDGEGFQHDLCSASINASLFMKYQTDFRFVLVCGFPDPTVDDFDNKLIALSKPFDIDNRAMPVATHFSGPMIDGIDGRIKDSGLPTGAGVVVPLTVFFHVGFLPRSGNCQVSDIYTMADIKRCGGRLYPTIVSYNTSVYGVVGASH
jgi:hypothetical protein